MFRSKNIEITISVVLVVAWMWLKQWFRTPEVRSNLKFFNCIGLRFVLYLNNFVFHILQKHEKYLFAYISSTQEYIALSRACQKESQDLWPNRMTLLHR